MDPLDPVRLPDESLLAFPESWQEHTLDRRGRAAPRPFEPDPDAPARLDALIAQTESDVERPLGVLDEFGQADAVRDGLAGKADPFAAAMALALLARLLRRREPVDEIGRDAWLIRHGLVFTARAAVEMLGNQLYWLQNSPQRDRAHISPKPLYHLLREKEKVAWLAPIRSLLAALPPEEHAEAVAAVETHRDTEAKQFASAMLMPDQESWVLDACRLHSGQFRSALGGDTLWCMVSKPEHLRLSGIDRLEKGQAEPARIARILDTLGVDALPVFVNTLEQEHQPSAAERELLFDAIARMPSDAAVRYLLQDLTRPSTMAAFQVASEQFPTRALRAVAAIAPTATGPVRTRLSGLVKAMPLLTEALAALGESDREAVESLLRSAERHPVADEASVPQVFATPPWSKFKQRAAKPGPELVPPQVDELRWAEGERADWQSSPRSAYLTSTRYWERQLAHGLKRYNWDLLPELLAFGPEDEARARLAEWDGTAPTSNARTVKAILAKYGDAVAARVLQLVKQKPSFRPAVLPMVNLDAARLAASWISRSRSDRELARTWLDRHAASAAALLIPDALGKDAKRRQAAADALRHLAATDRSIVDSQAGEYGEAARDAVTALLDADPLDPGRRVPAPGRWADPAMLPQVLLTGRGTALPAEAVRTLMSALAVDDFDRPYAGVDLLTAECDPASLTGFSWALFELWIASGAPSKDAWAMDQLRRFADDDTVRRLTALIHQWPGQNQSRRSVRGLEVLGGIGSEAALRAVNDIAAKSKFKKLKSTAAEQIQVIAERRELTTEQLADRIVPDFGLEAADALVLDYGPRSFTVGFDEHLKPFVIDQKGKQRASAPKPAAADDLELAEAAHARFATLRRELKSTAAEQVKRLELAMVRGRTWSRAEFLRYLVEHPLMRHLSGRLIWQADTGGGPVSFRLAEDRSLADLEEEVVTLPEDAVVRIAHPLTLGGEVEQWAEILSDYEILQPFEQLSRPVLTLTDEERETGRLARFEGATVNQGALVGLLKRGWTYGSPKGRAEYRDAYFHELPGGGYLYIDPDPSIYPGYVEPKEEHRLKSVEIRLPSDGADPVALSEALMVVARLARSV